MRAAPIRTGLKLRLGLRVRLRCKALTIFSINLMTALLPAALRLHKNLFEATSRSARFNRNGWEGSGIIGSSQAQRRREAPLAARSMANETSSKTSNISSNKNLGRSPTHCYYICNLLDRCSSPAPGRLCLFSGASTQATQNSTTSQKSLANEAVFTNDIVAGSWAFFHVRRYIVEFSLNEAVLS